MTDTPYTDNDLRTEAARQHAALADDPDFMGVGEAMEDRAITQDRVALWGDLGEDQYDAAQRKIHDLINGAADVSRWAIDLGAEELTPAEHHLIHGDEGGPVRAAFHIALDPHLELDPRAYEEIADVIRGHLAFRED